MLQGKFCVTMRLLLHSRTWKLLYNWEFPDPYVVENKPSLADFYAFDSEHISVRVTQYHYMSFISNGRNGRGID